MIHLLFKRSGILATELQFTYIESGKGEGKRRLPSKKVVICFDKTVLPDNHLKTEHLLTEVYPGHVN